jgi:hypothetical protein
MDKLAATLVLVIAFWPGTAICQDEKTQAEVDRRKAILYMRGLQGVEVLVEEFGSDVERDGLTRDMLLTACELELRTHGVPVLSLEESVRVTGSPVLYLNVTMLKDEGAYAFSIVIQLQEDASLLRRPDLRVSGIVWRHGEIGTIGSRRIRELRDRAIDLVDQFANLYLAANPRKATAPKP